MTWHTWKPALALGAVLAAAGAASAGDRDTTALPRGSSGSVVMTLGGKGTAAKAASEDTELTRGFHHGGYHGHHYGWGGGWGGWGGYRGYYGGGFYRPYYGGYYGGFYRPYYYSSFYRPYYGGYYGGFGYGGLGYGGFYTNYYGYYPSYYSGCGYFLGISGGSGSGAPTVALGARPTGAQPSGDGTFPYDGGPSNPVPMPKATPSTATDLPISSNPSKMSGSTSPYRYKAYGEK